MSMELGAGSSDASSSRCSKSSSSSSSSGRSPSRSLASACSLGRMLAAGLTPSLSVDTETATAGDMFTQMRTAYAVARRDRLEARNARPPVSARDVLRWATLQGARATGLERRTGSLTPGKAADIILIRATDVNLAPVSSPADAIVLGAHPGNVDTVLVAGRVLKRGGHLEADLERARRLVQASHEHVLGA